ncbi:MULTISPECIES: signal peptidase I [unclassified Nonomuraea]|uniref:signal peptidase I n=1 Tax=unclassified Nonomuraea TaxID=2593643 RepID=UPI0033F37A73
MIRPHSAFLFLMLLLVPVGGCASVDLDVLSGLHLTMAGTSMEPTIKKGARLTARRVGDGYVPHVGDVIVYHRPPSWSDGDSDPEGMYVARVIGTPGSTVKCCDAHGRLELDGKPLDEPYVAASPASSLDFDAQVPPGRAWIMGDNRDVSLDSRSHRDADGGGTIGVSDVVGVVESPAG